MNSYMNQYKQNHISTASPEQILLMLYDGAIRFSRQAIMAGEQNNQVLKLERISKTMAIVVEFSNSLNHEIGGQIAADLDGLYQFIIRELTASRNDDSGEKLKTVEGLLVDLRQTWGEAVEVNRQQQIDADTSNLARQETQPGKAYVSLNAAG